MKIGVIQASSQTDKNGILYDAAKQYAKEHEIVNFGCFCGDDKKYSYIEISIEIGLLLVSKAVDFIVTGCSSGQGYPKDEAKRKIGDTELLKGIREKSQIDFISLLEMLDNELIEKVLEKKDVVSYVLANGSNIEMIDWMNRHI